MAEKMSNLILKAEISRNREVNDPVSATKSGDPGSWSGI